MDLPIYPSAFLKRAENVHSGAFVQQVTNVHPEAFVQRMRAEVLVRSNILMLDTLWVLLGTYLVETC